MKLKCPSVLQCTHHFDSCNVPFLNSLLTFPCLTILPCLTPMGVSYTPITNYPVIPLLTIPPWLTILPCLTILLPLTIFPHLTIRLSNSTVIANYPATANTFQMPRTASILTSSDVIWNRTFSHLWKITSPYNPKNSAFSKVSLHST